MAERAALLPASTRAPEPSRDTTPQALPERERSVPEPFLVSEVPLYGAAGIDDEDSQRALHTARLIREIAPVLGLNPSDVRVVVNRASENATGARGAAGLELHGVIQLHPRRYNPETPEGRYLLGHELAHTAQRTTDGAPGTRQETELEAEDIGAAVAQKVAFKRPVVRLRGNQPAAGDADVKLSLDETVKTTRKREIDRIRKALKHIFWISNSDITKALLTLQEMDFFTARAVVHSLEKERVELVDNINSHHYERFRPEIFACYAALTPSELGQFDEKLLIKMDLHELTAEEHLAAKYVLQYLKPDSISRLQESKNGPAVKAIFSNDPALNYDERVAKALEVESKKQKSEARDKGTLDGDKALSADFEEIKARMSDFFISDSKALAALDRAAKYTHETGKMQALAHALEECGALDTLINELPVKTLLADSRTDKGDGKPKVEVPRRKAFLMLLSFRPAYKNVEKAEELTSLGLLDWAVTDEDAYLAFQLIKSVPQRSRLSFMKADDGARWKNTTGELTAQMRQSEAMNFYGGGKDQLDKAAIEAPLADAGLWTAGRASELDGRVRMAIASGDHQFVFEESRRRKAFQTKALCGLVEKYKLYNPDAIGLNGEAAPRTEYSPELLVGTSFWQEGPFATVATIGRAVSLSTDLKKRYGKVSARHLSVADIQDLLGGDVAGAAFKSDQQVQDEEKTTGQSLGGGNFIDKLDIDMAAGVLNVEARVLSLASIRYFLGDTLIQCGEGTLKGVRVRAGYPKSGTQAHFMKAEVDSVGLSDVLITSTDSITAVGKTDIGGARLASASIAVDYAHQNEKNKDNWFENFIQQIPILSPLSNPLLGLVRLAGNFGDISKAFKQSGEFSISADSVVLTGLTTSSGQHIESLELTGASFRSGDQIQGYKRALEASLATFPSRINAETAKVAAAGKPEDKATHQRSLERLNQQKARVESELAQVVVDQAIIADLEAKKKQGKLSPEEEQRLANLKRGGTALDIESVKLKGVSGRASSGDLELGNLHGQGRLAQFVEGSDGRPILKSQEDASKLNVDVGDISAKNVAIRKSPPSAEALAKQIAGIKKKLGDHPPDIRTADKLVQLEKVYKKVARYEELAALGAADQSDAERDEFAALRTELYDQASRQIGDVSLDGASIELDFTGGLSGLAELRTTLRKAALSAESITLGNVTVPGTGFHANSVTATRPKVSFTPGEKETRVEFDAAGIVASGLSLQRTKEDLQEQAKLLRGKALPPAEEHRLRDIESALADLQEIADKAAADEAALKAARGTLGEAKAEEELDKDKQALQKWQDQLVARSLSVTGLHASVGLAGNLLSDDFDSDNLAANAHLKFDEAEVVGAEAGPNSAKSVKFTGAEGDVQYTDSKITIPNFQLAGLSVSGLNYRGDQTSVSSSGVTSLTGITASASIVYEKGEGGDLKSTHATIDSLLIQSIAADNLHYEDTSGKDKVTVDVPSGALKGVHLTRFEITIPDDPDEKTAFTGQLDVKSVERFKVLAQVGTGLKASGTVDASTLKVDFLQDGDQLINIGDLNVTEGDVQKGGTHAKIKVSHLSGDVRRKQDGTTEFSLPIDKIEVPLLDWRSKDQSVFTDQPLVLSGISVTGSVHQNKASKEHEVDLFHISKLHVQTVTGEYLKYHAGEVTFEIRKDDPKQKDPATALRVDGIDIVGLEWRPKKGLSIDNLDVKHLAASFALEVGTKARTDVTAGGALTADRLNVRILRGGKLVSKVDDLNADVHGKAYGADFKASLKGLKTTVSKDGDTINVDPLTIKSIPVTQFAYSTPNFALELPAGAGDVTFHDLQASLTVNLTPAPKPGSAPAGTPKVEPPLIESIIVNSLVIPTTTGTGFTITLPSLGNLKLEVGKGNDLKLGKIELQGPSKKGGGPFRIENKSGVWNALGKIVLTDGDIQKLGFDVAGALKGSAKVHAEGGSLEFTAKGTLIDVNRVTLEELEAAAGSGTFKLVRGAGGSSFPGAGAEARGIHIGENGDVTVDQASVTGLTYDDPATGLHLDLNRVTLPKGVKKESGKPLHIDHVDLNEAAFQLDISKLGAGAATGSGPSYAPKDYEFLNQLTGHANAHASIHVHNLGRLERAAGAENFPDIPLLVDINHGAINPKQIRANLPFTLHGKIEFKFDANTGLWTFNVSGNVRRRAMIPAGEQANVEQSVRLAVIVNGTSVAAPATTAADPVIDTVDVREVDVLLHLDNAADIDLGGNGTINLHSGGKGGPLEFRAQQPGLITSPDGIPMRISNLEASVSNLKLGGASLDAASIAIGSVKDTRLHFNKPTADVIKAGVLEGKIENGSADNIDLKFGGGAAAGPTSTPTPGQKKGTP